MARVLLGKSAEETLKGYSPGDQEAVARAISFLEDDRTREGNRVDLFLLEKDLKVWGLFVGNIFFGFVEGGGDDVAVIHIGLLSRIRYPVLEQ